MYAIERRDITVKATIVATKNVFKKASTAAEMVNNAPPNITVNNFFVVIYYLP